MAYIFDEQAQEKLEEFILNVKNQVTSTNIAEFLGIGRRTYFDHLKKNSHFSHFIKKCKSERDGNYQAIVENAQLKMIEGYFQTETEDRVVNNEVITLTKKKYFKGEPAVVIHALKNLNATRWNEAVTAQIALDNGMNRDVNLDLIYSNLSLSVNIINRGLMSSKDKYIGLIGGAGSGKTHDIVQYYTKQLLDNEMNNLVVIRKHSNTIINSIYAEYKKVLKDKGFLKSSNKVDKILRLNFGNDRRTQEIIFRGIENEEALDDLKGLKTTDGEDFNMCHVEELSQIDKEVFDSLPTRIRGTNNIEMRVAFTTNPVRGSSWIKQDFIDKESKYSITRSTYLDNPNLSKDYHAYMMVLKETNPILYAQYGKGEFPSLGQNIFPEDSYTEVFEVTNDWQFLGIGIDVGYVRDPSVIIKAYRRQSSEKTLDGYDYLFEECFYKSTPTPATILHDKLLTLKDVNYDTLIYPESNPVDVAIVLQQMGFRNVTPVIKGAGSILKGLGVLTSIKPYLKGANLIKEVQNYEWQSDGKGNHIEQPAKGQMDHGIDAMRYFVMMYKETHHHVY